ncbi:MAG TPA: hypothetical protein VKS24_10095 [Bradyrhizobium sp.]|nr:hypothetical protein [Bradyrhizobium sp.]
MSLRRRTVFEGKHRIEPAGIAGNRNGAELGEPPIGTWQDSKFKRLPLSQARARPVRLLKMR